MPKLKNSDATFWVIFKHCVKGKVMIMEKKEVNVAITCKKSPKIPRSPKRRRRDVNFFLGSFRVCLQFSPILQKEKIMSE